MLENLGRKDVTVLRPHVRNFQLAHSSLAYLLIAYS